MPTYEYLCQTCSHRFETWQKMADEPLTTCPECGNAIRRVLYPAGIVFKGHGFYKTDHSGNSSSGSETKKAETTSGGETKASESTATTSSKESGESKPASSSPTPAA